MISPLANKYDIIYNYHGIVNIYAVNNLECCHQIYGLPNSKHVTVKSRGVLFIVEGYMKKNIIYLNKMDHSIIYQPNNIQSIITTLIYINLSSPIAGLYTKYDQVT